MRLQPRSQGFSLTNKPLNQSIGGPFLTDISDHLPIFAVTSGYKGKALGTRLVRLLFYLSIIPSVLVAR